MLERVRSRLMLSMRMRLLPVVCNMLRQRLGLSTESGLGNERL